MLIALSALDWHGINFHQDITRIVGRVSAAVFVGPELARNPEWQDLTIAYTLNFFSMAPAHCATGQTFSAPSSTGFYRNAKTCAQVRLARQLMRPVLEERAATKKAMDAEGRTCQYHDAIE